MNCPKCLKSDFKTWYGGGFHKAQCLHCFWHGLSDSAHKISSQVLRIDSLFNNRNQFIFDIGQLTKEDKNILNKMLRKGKVAKTKALWPWITSGTCKKTLYSLVY